MKPGFDPSCLIPSQDFCPALSPRMHPHGGSQQDLLYPGLAACSEESTFYLTGASLISTSSTCGNTGQGGGVESDGTPPEGRQMCEDSLFMHPSEPPFIHTIWLLLSHKDIWFWPRQPSRATAPPTVQVCENPGRKRQVQTLHPKSEYPSAQQLKLPSHRVSLPPASPPLLTLVS